LLAAWFKLNGRETIILPGVGRMAVRKAVAIVAVIEALICLVWLGWLVTLAMLCGGGAGWCYLVWRSKQALKYSNRPGERERVRRL
jgi:hypothetical protein